MCQRLAGRCPDICLVLPVEVKNLYLSLHPKWCERPMSFSTWMWICSSWILWQTNFKTQTWIEPIYWEDGKHYGGKVSTAVLNYLCFQFSTHFQNIRISLGNLEVTWPLWGEGLHRIYKTNSILSGPQSSCWSLSDYSNYFMSGIELWMNFKILQMYCVPRAVPDMRL